MLRGKQRLLDEVTSKRPSIPHKNSTGHPRGKLCERLSVGAFFAKRGNRESDKDELAALGMGLDKLFE